MAIILLTDDWRKFINLRNIVKHDWIKSSGRHEAFFCIVDGFMAEGYSLTSTHSNEFVLRCISGTRGNDE
jgi:hypothetical protein